MKQGDILELQVLRLGAQGDGLGEMSGRPVYIPLALPGETVRVRLTRPIGEGYQGELADILIPSPGRATPACSHFSVCGGCSLQHLALADYLAFKRGVVQGALRQHRLDDSVVRTPLSTPPLTRRRLTLCAQAGPGGRVILGFNTRASHRIIDITECVVARPALVALLPVLRQVLAPWLAKVRTLDLTMTDTDSGIDLLVTGAGPDLAAREALASLAGETSLARISWRTAERTASEPVLVRHDPLVSIAGHMLPFPPGAFLQASAEGEAALTEQVLAALGPTAGPVADLFAGLGTFSLPLAERCPVTAHESEASLLTALGSLRHPKIRTVTRDLFRDPLTDRELDAFAAVVIDPPRAGAQAQTAHLARSRVPVIVAVSCNPGTFARDAATLTAAGYELEWVQPVDQFLWSGHIELVARFAR